MDFSSRLQTVFHELKANWRHDLLAGFQVFLIALPLCLGISIASGFPPMAGLIAAIVGGLLVSRVSGSFVTISGPAAGLIVVILDGVHRLGRGDNVLGYKLTLAAIVCAGILQMIFGIIKAGRLSAFFPAAAVHGMLTAIGIIIIAKQIHIMLGVKLASSSILGSITSIPHSILNLNPQIAGIGVASLLALIVHPYIPWKGIKKVPAPLWAIGLGVILSQYFGLEQNHSYSLGGREYGVGPDYLLSLSGGLVDALTFPDFTAIFSSDFLMVVASIALIASIETILSAVAVDKLDVEKRKTDLNQDLLAIGLGTTVSGLLGGLPMISEIVRSSANVNCGAKTQWSNFFHGLFILLLILLAPALLHVIPLASLAALLVFTGFRLASPHEFRRVKFLGLDQLGVFSITIVSILLTDLLLGIALGISAKLLLHFVRIVPLKSFFKAQFQLQKLSSSAYCLKVEGPLMFLNYISFTYAMDSIPRDSSLVISLHDATFLDHTVMEYLHQIEHEFSAAAGAFTIEGHDRHHKYSLHPLAARRLKSDLK